MGTRLTELDYRWPTLVGELSTQGLDVGSRQGLLQVGGHGGGCAAMGGQGLREEGVVRRPAVDGSDDLAAHYTSGLDAVAWRGAGEVDRGVGGCLDGNGGG